MWTKLLVRVFIGIIATTHFVTVTGVLSKQEILFRNFNHRRKHGPGVGEDEALTSKLRGRHVLSTWPASSGRPRHKPSSSSSGTSNRHTERTFQHEPFIAYWNVPSYNCSHQFDVHLHLADYGIVSNKGENFTGDTIVIFYQDELGLYPQYNKTLQPLNGGLPQLADLSAHLEKATEDILSAIPDPDFNGIGIIDWESWRPQWEQNFDTREIYCKESKKVIAARHPSWANDTIEAVAEVEFEQAAKSFMDSTLRLVKQLRPNGHWGFYHFPYCYNENKPACNPHAVLTNNNITWLFDSSTAIYPSIYLPGGLNNATEFVDGKLTEALRVRQMSRNEYVDIYPYTRYLYSHSELYYTKTALNDTILQSAELGCSGVIFWGSNNDTHTLESCSQLQSYIKTTLGPFVKEVTGAASDCSVSLCSGHGRCTGDIVSCAQHLKSLKKPRAKVKDGNSSVMPREAWHRQNLVPCKCNCYRGWGGASCNQTDTRSNRNNA